MRFRLAKVKKIDIWGFLLCFVCLKLNVDGTARGKPRPTSIDEFFVTT